MIQAICKCIYKYPSAPAPCVKALTHHTTLRTAITMSSLFNNAVKQQSIVVSQLEQLRAAPEDAPNVAFGRVSSSLTAFQRAIDAYASAANNELVVDKKQQAQDRVLKFREEMVKFREELRSLKSKKEDLVMQQSRNELFHRGGEAQAGENPFAQQSQQSIRRDEGLSRESDVLGRASSQLDEFIEQGRLALGDLAEQNEMLKKTGAGMRKVANTLGISNETIRKIQRRARGDKYIFYGGCLFTFICFILIIRWLR